MLLGSPGKNIMHGVLDAFSESLISRFDLVTKTGVTQQVHRLAGGEHRRRAQGYQWGFNGDYRWQVYPLRRPDLALVMMDRDERSSLQQGYAITNYILGRLSPLPSNTEFRLYFHYSRLHSTECQRNLALVYYNMHANTHIQTHSYSSIITVS